MTRRRFHDIKCPFARRACDPPPHNGGKRFKASGRGASPGFSRTAKRLSGVGAGSRSEEWTETETGEAYEKTGNDHLWTLDLMRKMSGLRNMTIRKMLDAGYDYWFSVDTDIVLDPRTLKTLIEADKDIVSEIFWTKAPSGFYWCNAWMADQSAGMQERWKIPGLYRCGMTGALTLVKRKVFEAGVDYTPIPNIRTALRGEDRHFCVRAACAGFEMWIDSHCPAEHLYTRSVYNDYMARRRETCLQK